MNSIFILFLSLIPLVTFAQDSTKLDYTFAPKFNGNMNIRHFSDGSFVVLAQKRGKYNYKYTASRYDASGQKKEDIKDNKCLEAFCVESDNSFSFTKYSTAMNQSNEAFMFDPQEQQMLRFECRKAIFRVARMTIDGKRKKYELIDMKIPGGARLTDWEIFKLDQSTYRSILIYNGFDKAKITILQIDFNKDDNSFQFKTAELLNEDSKTWVRPCLNFIKLIGNKMLVTYSGGGAFQFMMLDENLKLESLDFKVPVLEDIQVEDAVWISRPGDSYDFIAIEVFKVIEAEILQLSETSFGYSNLVIPKFMLFKVEIDEGEIYFEDETIVLDFGPGLKIRTGYVPHTEQGQSTVVNDLYNYEHDADFEYIKDGLIIMKRAGVVNIVTLTEDESDVESSKSLNSPLVLNNSGDNVFSSDKFDLVNDTQKYIPELTQLFWIYYYRSDQGERLLTLNRDLNEIYLYK